MNHEKQLQYLVNPDLDLLKLTPIEFLQSIAVPTVIDITGKDQSRTRVFTTLIHGNEPSGLIAFHQWLRENTSSDRKPATNIRIILPSITAALTEPVFSHRFLSGCEDLNRCFGFDDKTGEQYQLAAEIVEAINAVKPEAVIDLHNTSGCSPAFSVAVSAGTEEKNLAAFFCNHLIHTEIRLGALMEQQFNCPIVTIECGGSDEIISVKRAYHGIKLIAEMSDLGIELENEAVDIYKDPVRVLLNGGLTLAYSDEQVEDKSLVLMSDNERRNFGITHAGTFLGWIKGNCIDYLTALSKTGKNISDELFKVEQGKLYTAKDLNFFMATDRADIAVRDCLFYVIEA